MNTTESTAASTQDAALQPIALADEGRHPSPWLTSAILAALPPDGTPVVASTVNGIPIALMGACVDHIQDGDTLTEPMVGRTLAALVASGGIEVSHGEDGLATWRRWGVPEGWGTWEEQERNAVVSLMHDGLVYADVRADGHWAVFPPCKPHSAVQPDKVIQDIATPPTLASAKRAALRACWERGVFSPAAPTRPTYAETMALPPCSPSKRCGAAGCPLCGAKPIASDQAQRMRDRLIALLATRPRKEQDLLLDAIGYWAPASLTVTVLHSIGAVTDGEHWRLSEGAPPGWGWDGPRGCEAYLKQIHLFSEPDFVGIAWPNGAWFIGAADNERVLASGTATPADLPSAQAAALIACRRAGLFGPVASTVPAPLRVTLSEPKEESAPVVMTVHTPPDLFPPSPIGEDPSSSSPLDAAILPLAAGIWKGGMDLRGELRAFAEAVVCEAHSSAAHACEDCAAYYAAVKADREKPPAPHPHHGRNEEPWETIERLKWERDEQRDAAAEAEKRVDALAYDLEAAKHRAMLASENAAAADRRADTLATALDAANASRREAERSRDAWREEATLWKQRAERSAKRAEEAERIVEGVRVLAEPLIAAVAGRKGGAT